MTRAPLHIGILQADSVLDQFQPEFGNYPGMVETVLGRTGADLRFTTYDVEHGEYPSAHSDCDGYVITGSKKSVYDDEPWIHELAAYVVELDRYRMPTVGICFGHQLIAHALGGLTESADVGWGVGVHHSKIVSRAEFMEPDLDGYNLIVSHKDQVTRLPDGAELLASSEFCPNAMFRVGNHLFGFQGHPEFCKEYSRALMEFRREILGAEKYAPGVASLECSTDEVVIAQWAINFLSHSL